MAFQQESVKTIAVAALAATHAFGAPLLPIASTIALVVIQVFSLMQALVAPSGKSPSKEDVSFPRSAAKWLPSALPSAAASVRSASFLMLAIAFARGLRSLGLSGSLPQVVALACFGGSICKAGMLVARKFAGSAVACSTYDAIAWPSLRLDEEVEEKSSPLSSLAEEYYSPNSMLSSSSFLDTEVSAGQDCSQSAPVQQVRVAQSKVMRSAGISRPSLADVARYALCLALVIAFARVLRSLGLSESLLQVVALACLGGCLCQAGMMVARKFSGGAVECCTRGPIFWPTLDLDEEEKDDKASPLSRLAEEYYSPESMLSASSFLDMED